MSHRIVRYAMIPLILPFWTGCKNLPNAGGFTVQTREIVVSSSGLPAGGGPASWIHVNGKWAKDASGAGGTFYSYDGRTDWLGGDLIVAGGRAPAYWDHYADWPEYCGVDSLVSVGPGYWTYGAKNILTTTNSPIVDICYTSDSGIPNASSRFAILGQFPQTITLSSQAPFTTDYGMPVMYVYDQTGQAVQSVTANGVSSDGSQATFPFPSSLTQNAYWISVANQTAASPGFSNASYNILSIASSQTIAGNPFGVAVGAQSYDWEYYNHCTQVDNSSYEDLRFPVVSLYGQNQVLINGNPVTVGSNPTAVATYTAPPVNIVNRDRCSSSTAIYSGTTRAIVANSGANTVSILDIVDNSLVTNVTVGSQPVALVVSSDGSTAYVANYQSSTISCVNLITGTVTSTVAVGGQPTSVALTSAGILWVGGVGFLTEINTQTMAVMGTEAIPGKNIIALGFSNSVNELIATAVDANSNVYADEINPSTFQGGGAYAPAASHMISTLGTYIRQPTGLQVRAFSSTLANTTSISTNQVGAPPLVVQDGWAVVTATPTGFTITDASGHIVLVSETTPSPITAIAVDSKLHVAYLTMPDSNTMLTVPLPGTD